MACRVCGKEGADICTECRFTEENRQCWKCRIFIPKHGLQHWRGFWYCPHCLNKIILLDTKTAAGQVKLECQRCGVLHPKSGLFEWGDKAVCANCKKQLEDGKPWMPVSAYTEKPGLIDMFFSSIEAAVKAAKDAATKKERRRKRRGRRKKRMLGKRLLDKPDWSAWKLD